MGTLFLSQMRSDLNQTWYQCSTGGPSGQVRQWSPSGQRSRSQRSKHKMHISRISWQTGTFFSCQTWLDLNQTRWQHCWQGPSGQVWRWPWKVKGQGHRGQIKKITFFGLFTPLMLMNIDETWYEHLGQQLSIYIIRDFAQGQRSRSQRSKHKMHISRISWQTGTLFSCQTRLDLNQTRWQHCWQGPPGQVWRWPWKVKGQGHRGQIKKITFWLFCPLLIMMNINKTWYEHWGQQLAKYIIRNFAQGQRSRSQCS